MKKYIIGTIFGFVLATAVSANAQEVNRLIDSVVQGTFPVTIEGSPVGDAIVVNDKTYLPVREFGEATGYTVTFTESREVVLTKNETSSEPSINPVPTTTPSPTLSKEEIENKINFLKTQIRIANIDTGSLEEGIKNNPDKASEYQKLIEQLKLRITDYETQITALESKK